MTGGDGGDLLQPGDFLPSFTVHTVHTDETTGEVYDKWDDTALFDFYFEKVEMPEDSFDRVITRYEAISCIEYINGPYWNGYTQVEKESALAQLEFGEN